ncbi:hypothetical protein CSAL01_10489 [Colletotrichum salicis]|uniref:Nucleoside phosphorylase domain-containing protein n=1 Tax=Colletotrichum salicis TaxID=1209931 RepID=A0A135U133_9PEZI|nr:hypothetical protein CSAL01_10489 [Colletotrichum salicis]
MCDGIYTNPSYTGLPNRQKNVSEDASACSTCMMALSVSLRYHPMASSSEAPDQLIRWCLSEECFAEAILRRLNVQLAFDELWDESEHGLGKAAGDANTYTLGRIGEHNAVLVLLSGIGKVNAAIATVSLRSSFGGLKLALLCGICGGVPNAHGDGEMLLGDVVISNSVVQYDMGRRFPGQFEPKTAIQDSLSRPIKEVRSLLIAFETHRQKQRLQKEISKGLTEIQNKAVEESYDVDYSRPTYKDVLFEPDYTHGHRSDVQCSCNETQTCEKATKATCEELGCDLKHQVPRRRLESQRAGQEKTSAEHQPHVFLGSIGSGDTVMKSGKDRDQIARGRSLVAFEMEVAGVWDEIPCIIVKGVCDYADSHKNKTWQHYAAATAAVATKALLDCYAPTAVRIEQAKPVGTIGFSPKFLLPYVKNPESVGREEIFNRITHLFGDTQTGLPTTKLRSRVALHGLGGVGSKTQIALAYAYWVHETFPEVSVFWAHASNRQRFRQAFISIAQVCGILGYDEKKAATLLLVKQWLESKKSGPWLLIIDNADDKGIFFRDYEDHDHVTEASSPASEDGLGRFIPKCLHGSVLITTRDMQTGLRMSLGVPPIKVDEMIDAEAVELLQSLLPNQNFSPSEAIALASRLEYLPLALAQRASFILKNFMSINDYVQILEKSDSSLVRQLSEPFASVGRDSETPHALTATWLISFRQIEQRYPLAGDLLSFMSMFDRQAIPKAFVEDYCYEQLRKRSESNDDADAPFEGDSGIGSDCSSDSDTAAAGSSAGSEAGSDAGSDHGTNANSDAGSEDDSETTLEVANALGILQAFSFISQASNGTYDMHRLVHLVTRKRLLQEKKMPQLSSEALGMMARAFPYGQFENRVACLTYLPHTLAILALSSPRSDNEKIQTGQLLHNVAGYFEYQGQDSDAEKYLTRALELRRAVLGDEHHETRKTMRDLALSHVYQYHLEVAIELLLPTLQAQKRLLAESDGEVLHTRRILASAYLRQGRYEDVEKPYLEALEICKEAGEDKKSMSHILAELSTVYFKQGRTSLREARSFNSGGRALVEGIRFQKIIEGEEHGDTTETKIELGRLYRSQGRLVEAEELSLKMLELCRITLGEEHEDTVAVMADLGQVYLKQSRLKEAEESFLKVLHLRRTVSGEEHQNTAWIMGELGLLYPNQTQLAEAESLQLRALELWRKISGEERVKTLVQENNLAWTWWQRGRKEEAIQRMRKCAKARERVLGRDHERTKASLESLSYWEKEMDTEHSSNDESGHASEECSEDEEEDTYAPSYVGSDDDSDDGEEARL